MLKLLRLTTAPCVALLALIAGCSTASAPQATSPSPTAAQPPSSPQPDPFREAVNSATSVAILAKKAKCEGNSNSLVSQWEEAIELMNAVPISNPNYVLAQQKVANYQQNLNQAKSFENQQNITENQIQKAETRIADAEVKIEEIPVEISEIELLVDRGDLSEIDGVEQITKAKNQVLETKLELLTQIHEKHKINQGTISKEDIARINCELANAKERLRIIEGKQSPLVTQTSDTEHSQETQAVLDDFLALNSRLEVGINYQDYASQVGDLKIALDQFAQVAEETNISTYHKLEKAFARYKYALDRWSDCSRTDSSCLKNDYSFEWNSAQQWLESAQKDLKSVK